MNEITGQNLANSSNKHKRSKTDLYSTPKDVTLALLKFLKLKRGSRIWECACGEGMMADVLKVYSNYTVLATDLHDYGYGISGIDFTVHPTVFGEWIITNPPFSFSAEFIDRGIWWLEEIDGFAFLLKSQYWHAASRLPLFKKRPPAYVLPLTWRPDFAFGERGGAPTMECLWTVWKRYSTITEYTLLERPESCLFCNGSGLAPDECKNSDLERCPDCLGIGYI